LSATYTWDVFSTLDGYGSFVEGADWGGYLREDTPVRGAQGDRRTELDCGPLTAATA
jgi:hypothetical protein